MSVTIPVELSIDWRLVDLWQRATELVGDDPDTLHSVGLLMRASWGQGYYDGLSDRTGSFLREHGYTDPRRST